MLRGDEQIIRLQGNVPLPFIGEEEKGAVLDDRSAYGASVIVIVIGEIYGRKVVLRVQPVIVTEIEGRAVEIVSTALERHIDGGTTLDAVLRTRKLLNAKNYFSSINL